MVVLYWISGILHIFGGGELKRTSGELLANELLMNYVSYLALRPGVDLFPKIRIMVIADVHCFFTVFSKIS
jgi:hypothetical protein